MITLTHSPAARNAGLDIRESFQMAINRLRRSGVIFDYLKVVEYTVRGEPHIHMLYRGRFYLKVMLSWLWSEIHLSPVVWIQAIRSPRDGAHYVAKYLGKDARARYSMSHGWLWVGAARDWKAFVAVSVRDGWEWEKLLEKWDRILDSRGPERYIHSMLSALGVWWVSPLQSSSSWQPLSSLPVPAPVGQLSLDL